MHSRPWILLCTAALTNTALTACGTSTEDSTSGDTEPGMCGALVEPTAWPTSGYYLHFTAAEQHAHVWVDSTEGIAHVEAWLADPAGPIGIPGGPIELDGTFNPGYSYRLVPDQVTFADVWVEVCDAAPCYIEDDPSGWFDNPNDWCPWAFTLAELWDCRDGDGASCELVD